MKFGGVGWWWEVDRLIGGDVDNGDGMRYWEMGRLGDVEMGRCWLGRCWE